MSILSSGKYKRGVNSSLNLCPLHMLNKCPGLDGYWFLNFLGKTLGINYAAYSLYSKNKVLP